MAKKKIVGRTKLREGIQPGDSSSIQLNRITPKKKSIAKTYRFKETDLQRLREIANAINKESSTHISDTSLIRTLILIGKKTNPAKIIKAYRELI